MTDLPKTTDATLTLKDRVATLTLNRDDMRNALTGNTMIDDIENTMAWANKCSDVSVIIITGAGKAFSSGGNVKEMAKRTGSFGGSTRDVAQGYRDGIQRIPMAIDSVEVPVIAAVNGAAIGAGCDLTAMCDIRIASDKALFGETFLNLGLIPGDGGAYFLQRLIGYQRASELHYTGRTFDAQEALDMGFVMEVVPHDELMDRVNKLASIMASKPPITVRYTKRLMKLAQRANLSDFLDQCAEFQAHCHQTEDHAEAVNAFVEKRKAAFKAR